jgi:V-type H+-transporting ATPase 16kDa proteolipid subunit
VGIASMGVLRPELVMKSIVPVIMAGVLGIYGLIIAVIVSTGSMLPSRQTYMPAEAWSLHVAIVGQFQP